MKNNIRIFMKRMVIGLCVFLIAICNYGMIAEASNAPKFGFQLIGGLGEYGENERNWYFRGNSVYYLACAEYAMKMWEDTETNGIANYISFEKTKDSLDAEIFITISSDGSDARYNGYTVHTLNRGSVDPRHTSWDTADIVYNNTNGYIDSSKSYLVSAVIAHEIGHAFGLDENNANRNSIMCQWQAGRTAVSPTCNDIWSAICVYK